MDAKQFWAVIEKVKGRDDEDAHIERLSAALKRLEPAQVVSYFEQFLRARDAAYRHDLVAAAMLMNHGYMSDDSFTDFRNWLISRGEAVYTAALADADSLGDLPAPRHGVIFEGFGYAPVDVYEQMTGDDLYAAVEDSYPPQEPPDEEVGLEEDSNDALARRLPKLWAKYGKYKLKTDAERAEASDEDE